jgi:hypothetical protein
LVRRSMEERLYHRGQTLEGDDAYGRLSDTQMTAVDGGPTDFVDPPFCFQVINQRSSDDIFIHKRPMTKNLRAKIKLSCNK